MAVMNKRQKLVLSALIILLVMMNSAGCGRSEDEGEGRIYQIYTVNKEETKVSSYEYHTEAEGKEAIKELLAQLGEAPESTEERAAITEEMEMKYYTLQDKRLKIDFSEGYNKLSATGEVLTRAAIVRTLCQLDEVEYVSFLVAGKELTNAGGANVGMMNAEQFVENNGSEINAYERTVLKLYYADKEENLLKSYEREVLYNSNISMEKLVVEQMIEGPDDKSGDYAATINPETKVLSVTVKDGTCYVNLDTAFLTPVEHILPELTIYSIVNSLTELKNVNRVQISIDGKTDVSYMETISLSGTFERNYELME
jgi:germination protein M